MITPPQRRHQTIIFPPDTAGTMTALQRFNNSLTRVGTGIKERPLLRFLLVFISAFFLLQWVYQALIDTAVYRFFIEVLTVRPSAWLIQRLTSQDGVLAQGHRLLWPGGGLSVLNGCDGAEVMQLLFAAFAAADGPWRQRLHGAALGLLLVYVLNQLRIVGLYFAARHDRAWFELIHGMIGPLIIIALSTLFFAGWMGRDDPAHAA